ncbi:hypothetical protein JCM5350_003985 [Sporobolomyces pararoseus]
MSSSRYRDDRDDRRYPPSSQNRFPPSSHPHDSRPPSYPSAYPPPSHFSNDSSGSRFAPVVAGGSRSYDERGNYSSGSGGGGSAYATSSRYDDRRDRTGRDHVERAVGRDSRGAVGGDFRNSSTQTSQGRTGKAREDDRIFASGYTTTLSHSRDGQNSSNPYVSKPAQAVGKASYERSGTKATAFSPPSSASVPLPEGSPGMEPGELLPTPETKPVELPPAQLMARGDGGGGRSGNGWDRNRAEPSWAERSSTQQLGRFQRTGDDYSSKYSRPLSQSGYHPYSATYVSILSRFPWTSPVKILTIFAYRDSQDYRPSSSRRGASPPRGSSFSRPSLPLSRDRSPPRRSEKSIHPTTSRPNRSPDRTQHRRSASPPRRFSAAPKAATGSKPATRRGRSPTRSPRSRSRSLTISPPPKSRRRRRGSSCSSVSRSPSPPSGNHRSKANKATTSSRPRDTRRGRSLSRSPSISSTRSYSKSRSMSRSPRTSRNPSRKTDKRPRSPELKPVEGFHDKKAKITAEASRVPNLTDQHSTPLSHPPTSTITGSLSSSQRASLPLNPASYRQPLPSAPFASSAPTGPRALRPVLPGQPITSSNGLPVPLKHGARVTVDVPKGPKPKAGFAPIKTTQVAGPPASAQLPANPNLAKVGGIKKFFPGEDEDEEVQASNKAKETRKREEKEKLGREREESEREKERVERERIEADLDREETITREIVEEAQVGVGVGAEAEVGVEVGVFQESSERDAQGRKGWTIRNGGDVPPPRVRPLDDNDDSRHPLPSRGSINPQVIPSGPAAGPRRLNSNVVPTGPSSFQPRGPASYERPTSQSLAGPRNGFQGLTSSNAVVPGVVERKWGAPAPAPASTSTSTTSPVRPPRPNSSNASIPNGSPSPARPAQPIPSEPRSRKEAGTPPLELRPSRPLDFVPVPAPVAPSPASRIENGESLPVSDLPDPLVTLSAAPPEADSAAPTPQLAPEPEARKAVEPVTAQPTEFYERIVQVGEGTYGKVYKARNVETGQLVALKRIRMEAEKDGFPITAVREIKLLQNLRHPNVVDLSEMLVSKGHVYMVMEYMDHDLTGILHHPTVSFSPAHLKSLMKQFLEGLSFIHRRGVLHRDLKGSNILLGRSGELKIADFGLARFFARGRNNDYTNRVITQWYKPPELLFGATVYGEEVDMWSAGCIFLELFARRPVFQGQDEIHQLEVIFKLTGTPSIENWPGVQDLPWYELVKPKTTLPSQLRAVYSKLMTPAGLDVAERLLSLDPAGRPTAAEALRMDYFVSEEPQPQPPDFLSTLTGSWHEFESKRARRKAREDAGAA